MIGTVKFPKSTTCKAVIPVEGCEIYSAFDTCQKCYDGYNFVSETKCEQIAPGTNCNY